MERGRPARKIRLQTLILTAAFTGCEVDDKVS